MARQSGESDGGVGHEIAAGVYCLRAGNRFTGSNVYFVRSGSSWSLIDTAWASSGRLIRVTAESLFGEDLPPLSILLTHAHPDHAGSARELAQAWGCPVYVHRDELRLAAGELASFKEYAGPLDRWIVLPLLHLIPPHRRRSMMTKGSVGDALRALAPGPSVPGLPEWECVPTPGHTPGHSAFFRRNDRVLIAGDALLTVDVNSPWTYLLNQRRLSGPPWYTTWSRQAAKDSIAALAALEPRVVGGGHGVPLTGDETAQDVRAFSDRFQAHS